MWLNLLGPNQIQSLKSLITYTSYILLFNDHIISDLVFISKLHLINHII